MLLLQGNYGALSPELDVVPRGKMKILLMFLGLFSHSIAMPMHIPRMGGFGSKSEEMMRYGQYHFMNTPQMAHLGPLYGYFPQQFPQFQMPMWPQPPPNAWLPPNPMPPNLPRPQMKAEEGQENPKPTQPQPTQLTPKVPTSKPPTPQPLPRPEEEDQPYPKYPPFGNGMFPFNQPPWQFPQMYNPGGFPSPQNPFHGRIPPGFGRPPNSNEEGGNPYFGYFGYHGFGGRPPYYSEEMFEQDFEKPKEEDPPKVESTTSSPPANTTVPENNSTLPTVPSPGGSQGGNETGTIGKETQAQDPGIHQAINPEINLAPTVNVSSYNGLGSPMPQSPYQPNVFENSPNPTLTGFPVGRQWSQTRFALIPRQNVPFYRNYPTQRNYPWHNLAYVSKQIAGPGNTAYQKANPSVSKISSPNHVSNPTNNRRKPQVPTKNPEEPNGGTAGPKQGIISKDEQIQNPKERPTTQRERVTFPTRDPTSPWRNSQGYETNKSNYKLPPLEGNPSVPSVNSVDQHENSYFPRIDSRRFPVGVQASYLPKGIGSEPRKGPSDSEINPTEIKHDTHHPEYPEEGPYSPKESFFPGSNTWKPQQGSPNFEDEPMKQEGPLLYPSLGARGSIPNPQYTPYNPQESSPYVKGNTWDEGDDLPGTFRPAGQAGNPSHSLNTPSDQRHPSTHNEEDPIDPAGDEYYREPDAWDKESNFKESQVRYHGRHPSIPKHPSDPKEYFRYSTDNLPRQRGSPYGEYYPWYQREHFPSYNIAPPLAPPGKNNRYYYPSNVFQQEEGMVSPSWGLWDQKNYAPAKKGIMAYYSRDLWDQTINSHRSEASALDQRENQPHSDNFPSGLRGDPTYQEAESPNYDNVQMNGVNSPGKEQLDITESVIQNNPINQEENSYPPASQRGPCCAGDPTGSIDSLYVPLDYFPPFGLVSGERGERDPIYPEGSHTKHARHIIYSTGIQLNQRNDSEKYQPEKGENPDSLWDDTATLKKSIPCSKRSQVGQTGNMPFSEGDPLQANIPCQKSNLRGNGNHFLAKIFGTNQFNERTNNLIPEELEAPKVGLKAEDIQSEGGGSEGYMKKKGVPSFQKVPCLHSKIGENLPSSTSSPPFKRRPDPSEGESTMVSAQPSNTLTGSAAREQLSSTNIASELHLSFPSLPRNSEIQVPDCLLLQS